MAQSRFQSVVRMALGVTLLGISAWAGAQCFPYGCPRVPSTTTLTAWPAAIYAGQDVTLTARVGTSVRYACDGGQVILYDGAGVLGLAPVLATPGFTCPAILVTPNLQIGRQWLHARFGGNDRAAPSSSNSVGVSVFPNVGFYRASTGMFIVDYDADSIADTYVGFGGMPGDVALVGDVLGNGKDAFVIYRKGLWFVSTKWDGNADIVYAFGGRPGDIPLLADMDGDGKADLVIYRDGTWFVSTNRDGVANYHYYFGGVPGDIPLLADMNGDGTTDLIIYRAGTWFVSTKRDGVADQTFYFGGLNQDIPLLSNWYAADSTVDPIIFRDGLWFVGTHGVRDGTVGAVHAFGAAGDVPLQGAFR